MNMKWILPYSVVILNAPTVFLETPSSLNVTVGTVAKFNCSSEVASTFYWEVDGSYLDDPKNHDRMITEVFFVPRDNVKATTLYVPITTATTNTTVQCFAITVDSGQPTIHNSGLAVIMAQGPPEMVSGTSQSVAVDGSLHLSWTPPPTIDLTGVDPDLHYNITIVKHNCTLYDVRQSTVSCEECPLSVPEYTFGGEISAYVSYTLSVYAFNDAGRGESVSVRYSGSITAAPQFLSLNDFVTNTSSVTVTFQNEKELNMEVTLPELEYDLLQKIFIPIQTDEICYFILSTGTALYGFPIAGGMNLTISSTVLPFHVNYTVNISACNVYGCTSYGSNITLSTHNIQQVFLNNEQGVVNITTVFANGSPAKGCFIIFHFGDDNGAAQRFIAVLDDMEDQTIFTRIRNVTNGVHRVVLFDIEGDSGLPSKNAAIDTTVLVMDGMDVVSQTPPSTSLSANITTKEHSIICISCNFLSSDANGCLGLTYSQENPLQLTRYLILRPELTMSVCSCFHVGEGNYSVAVFTINFRSADGITITERFPATVVYTSLSTEDPSTTVPESNSKTSLIAAVVTATTVTAVAVFVLLATVVVIVKKKSVGHAQARHSSEIVLQSNQVYDVVKQQQRSGRAVQLEPCSAVGVHGDTDADPEYETVS